MLFRSEDRFHDRVMVRQCDIGDGQRASNLMIEVHQHVAPIKGVIHAAGVLRDALLARQTEASFDEVWMPKAVGAMHLHRTCVEQVETELDLFVMFSSQTALFGNAGQANYGAANTVLDALAVRRRSMGLCGTSIQWGAWVEAGMAVESNVVGKMWSQGMRGIRNDEGFDALDLCVSEGQPPVIAMVPVVQIGRAHV